MAVMKFSVKPVGFRILVKPDDLEKTHKVEGTDIELALPDLDERLKMNAQIKGTVLAIGPKAYKPFSNDYTGEPWIKPGDRIYYARHAGKFIKDPVTEEELLLLNDDDVTAVMTGKVKELEVKDG